MGPSQLSTTLFATLITSMCYGIAVTLFVKSVGTMVRKKRATGQLNLVLAITSPMLFIFATLNVIGLWVNIHAAFVLYPKGPKVYLALIRTPAKTVIQTGQVGAILLADALVVYRTFIVWGYSIYVIVLPCMTFVATFISGVAFVRLQHITNVETSIFSNNVTEWTVAFLLCSFATTIYSTGLIGYKLLRAQRQMRKHGVSTTGSLSRRIVKIIAESAALYSLNHLLYAILYEVKTNVESTPSFLEASIASITCSLIIVRSEQAINRPQTLPTCVDSDLPPLPLSKGKHSQNQDERVFALRSMVDLEVARTTHAEGGDSKV